MANKKITTMKLSGNDYAKVAERVKEFRKDNPNGFIETFPMPQTDGQMMFKARILKDKSDPNSAEAIGHSMGNLTKDKGFEKLETIAVGRALAYLGYAADGDIASSEETEEFEIYKAERHQEAVMEMREKLEDCKTLKELARVWSDFPMSEAKAEVTAYKDELKEKLTKPATKEAPKEMEHGDA